MEIEKIIKSIKMKVLSDILSEISILLLSVCKCLAYQNF